MDSSGQANQGLKYALFGAIAVIAILVGALAVVAFGGVDGETPSNAGPDAEADTLSATNDGDSEGEDGSSNPSATADVTSPATQPSANGSGDGGNTSAQGQPPSSGNEPASTPTPSPTPAPAPGDGDPEPTTQSQQGATATATVTSTQQATATPTRTPTKPAPTATKPAPTATKTATKTATATPTKTATPTPTAPPTIIPNSSYFLDIEIDESESVSGPVARPSGPLGANVTVYIIFEGSATKARVVIQGTCTGTGAQHVRFVPHGDDFELIPCNRTLVDVVVQRSGNAPKAVAFIEVVALEPGPTNVQWTISATTLAVE